MIVILEKLRICPVEIGCIQKLAGYDNFTPQALEEENRVRELLPDHSNNVLPGWNGYHVPCITPETIYTTVTPGQEYIGHVLPQLFMPVVELGEIFPAHTPRAGHFDITL